jgi:hypothetical protein
MSNPFSARAIRPGAAPFLFPAGQSVEQLVGRLRQAAWWGQIVGQHGSGKSALLAALAPEIERAGMRPVMVDLHDGERCLPGEFRQAIERCNDAVAAVDGYEQLGRWERFRLKRFCRRRGLGLLVTAHASVGLPELFRTEVSEALAWQIVELLQRGAAARVEPQDVAQRLARHDGNLREALFDLYDLYEQRTPE